MEILKKTISTLLTLTMIVTTLPLPALATENETVAAGAPDGPSAAETESVETVPETTAPGEEATTPSEENVETISKHASSAEAVAASTVASGTCGENLTWTLEGGVLTIFGEGNMTDYFPVNYQGPYTPWYDNSTSITAVVVKPGVTSIGAYAFYACSSLTSVIIPEGVTFISYYAFESCSSLTNITIPDSVTSIGVHAFSACSSLTGITIPEGVTFIGNGAFRNCISLTNITIPDSVTSIGNEAFYGCSSLTSITIPESVTSIDIGAFHGCSSLTSITIPDSVTFVGNWTFCGCSSLTSITIPEGVTSIGDYTFWDCRSLTSITIPDSVTSIGMVAFANCGRLTDVYYSGSEEKWATISIGENNESLTNATIHYNSTTGGSDKDSLSIPGLSINSIGNDTCYLFMGDPNIYCMPSLDASGWRGFNLMLRYDEGCSPSDITWTSSDETILQVVSSENPDASIPNFVGVAVGTASLTAMNKDGDSFTLDVTVVKPNVVEVTNIYDTKFYHSSGGFYSADSSLSNSVEIFFELFNKVADRYPCVIPEDAADGFATDPITLTATVSGRDLSFDPESYQNIYTATYDPIALESSVYDLLMLYPMDIDSFCPESASYTVEVTLESECFESPMQETYSFTIYDAEYFEALEHISYIQTDKIYNISKQNIYGEKMVTEKEDPEYQWSKWSTFDFENYYEVVVADLLIDILKVPQANTHLIPSLLKEYHSNFKTLMDGIDTMVTDSYSDIFDVSELKIEKVFKASKYDTDGIYADDEVYQTVLDLFGTVGNVEKIQGIFKAIDRTEQVADGIKFIDNVIADFVTWGNTISVMNAFKNADDQLKEVFRSLAMAIPSSEEKMKEAVEDYLNYSHDFRGFAQELFESLKDLKTNVGLDTFNGVVGKKAWDFTAAKIVGWIGKIPCQGGVLASTTAFTTITAALGGAATGVSLGLCLSDLICNSEDKAAEMGKMIAMSEYAPYIVDVLTDYEGRLYSQKNSESVALFENAFQLHKAAQSYIIDHTISALEARAESIVQIIVGNREYYEVIAGALVDKSAIDSMACCKELDADTKVIATKVIAIKCPVDVYLYDGSGNEIVRIIADTVDYAADGLLVHIRDGEKYIALPANQEYSVKIIATDEGTMDYQVLEYNEDLKITQNLQKNDIPLVQDRVFTADLPQNAVTPEDYAIHFEDSTLIPDEAEQLHTHIAETDWSVDYTHHWHECTACGEKLDEAVHNANPCTICGYESVTEGDHPYALGDVNHDGKINAKDSTLILQYSVGVLKDTSKFCETCANVNGDSKLNAKDATMILQYSVGLRTDF